MPATWQGSEGQKGSTRSLKGLPDDMGVVPYLGALVLMILCKALYSVPLSPDTTNPLPLRWRFGA